MQGLTANKMMIPEVVDNRQQLQHSLDIVQKKVQADGSAYNFSLRRIQVFQEESDEFTLTLLIPEQDEVSQSDNELNTYPDIVALLKWLEDNRVSGNAVGSAVTTTSQRTSALGSREFEVAQASGETALRFQYRTGAGSFTISNGNFLQASFEFERVSGAAVNGDKLRDLMLDTEVSISTDGLKLNPRFASYDSWARFQRADFDSDHALEYIHDSLLYHGKPVGGERYSLPLGPGWGGSIAYSDLPIVNSKRIISFNSMHNSYHFNASSDGSMEIQNPLTVVKYPRANKTILIHNTSSASDCTVNDWDALEIIILKPGEHAIFQIELDKTGYAGKMIELYLPTRRIVHRYSAPGDGLPMADSDVPYWSLTSSLRLREFPFTTVNPFHINEDAFQVYTGIPTSGDQGSLNSAAVGAFSHRGSVRVKKKGILTVWWEILTRLDSNVTGSLGSYNAMRIYRVPSNGDNPETPVGEYFGASMSGSGAQAIYWLAGDFEVEPDDIIFAGLRYYSTNISFGSLRSRQITRRFTLQQSFIKEWSA